MPIFKAEFKVTAYYTVSIDAENWEDAWEAARCLSWDDVEIDGIEDEWRGGFDFDYMSQTPVVKGEGKILGAQEVIGNYSED